MYPSQMVRHSTYEPNVEALHFIAMCIFLTVMFYVLLKKTEDPNNKQRRYGTEPMVTIAAKANWHGVPPDGLVATHVRDKIKIVQMAQEIVPMYCPDCNKELCDYKSDFDVQTKEFRINGVFCAKGHWTYLKYDLS